jgi:hypothetical protein
MVLQAAEKLTVLKGHGFSRAEEWPTELGALAPEVYFRAFCLKSSLSPHQFSRKYSEERVSFLLARHSIAARKVGIPSAKPAWTTF